MTTVLTTADGVRLAARWWHPPVAGPEAVVIVHGFCGSKDERDVGRLASRLVAGGRRVLAFDLRGHGSSTGTCTLGGLERLDVAAAVDAARLEADVVIVVGTSLGGVAVVDHLGGGNAAAERAGSGGPPADGAVLVATPAHWQIPRSLRGLLSVALTQTRPGRAMVARRTGTRVAVRSARGAPPVARIRDVACPVAVVHGLADRFLSPAAATALFAAVPEPRLLDPVPGMGHGLSPAADGPIEAAVTWAVHARAAAPGAAGLPERPP